eukprot:403345313
MDPTQEQCIRCLIQNEYTIQQKLDIAIKPYTYFSFCQYESQGACCLTAADGSTLDTTGSDICLKGFCSHNQLVSGKVDLKKLNQLYSTCNLTTTEDQAMCGGRSQLMVSDYSAAMPALIISHNPDNNNTNGTNGTSGGNNTNGTTGGNNTNGTNGTTDGNNTNGTTGGNNSNGTTGGNNTNGTNETTGGNNTNGTNQTNGTNSTNNTNSTSNDTQNTNTTNNTEPNATDTQNSTNNNQTNNDTTSNNSNNTNTSTSTNTTDNNNQNETSSNSTTNSTTDPNNTTQINNNTTVTDQNNTGTNETDNSEQNQDNSQQNQTQQDDNSTQQNQTDPDNTTTIINNDNQSTNANNSDQSLNQNQSADQLLIPDIPSQQLSIKSISSENINIIDENSKHLRRLDYIDEMSEIIICTYQLKVADSMFNQYDKRSDGMSLQIAQNNINNYVFVIDSKKQKVTKIADQNYTFPVKQNESMTVFGFFDVSKYTLLYLEYNLQDQDFTEDITPGESDEDHMKSIIIVAIVVSCAVVLLLLIFSFYCLFRQCKKKQRVIVIQNVQELKKQFEKQQNSMSVTVPLNFDQEKQNMNMTSEVSVLQQPKKLSQLLVSQTPVMQPPKSARTNPRRPSMNGQGYNLTMDDLNRKSLGSKTQNTLVDMDRNKRSKQFDLERGSLIRSGSLPKFGEQDDINYNRTEQSDDKNEDAQTNFGNLVRLANEKMAKTINLHDSGDDSFKNMTYRSKAKSFKRNYKNSQGSDSMEDQDQNDIKNFQDNLNDDIQEQCEKEYTQSQGQGSMKNKKEFKSLNHDDSEPGNNFSFKRYQRPDTAKVNNNQVFQRRRQNGHQSAMRLRPSQDYDKFNMTIDQKRDNQQLDKEGMRHPAQRLNRGYTDVMEENNHQVNSHRIQSRDHDDDDLEAQKYNTIQKQQQDAQANNHSNTDKLKIFQSESRWEEYEYMEADADSINAQPIPQSVDDDLEIKSAFNSVLKQQLQEVKIVKPRRSILKNTKEVQQDLRNPGDSQVQQLDPKERRRQRLLALSIMKWRMKTMI